MDKTALEHNQTGTKELFLMNKNTPVCKMIYDYSLHECKEILCSENPKYAPPAILEKGNITPDAFNAWWRSRAIPVSRSGLSHITETLGITDTRKLLEINNGLSLSDRYWINEGRLRWSDINYFDNDFSDDLGVITLASDSSGNLKKDELVLLNPSSSLNGNMKKKWNIEKDGTRSLYKKGMDSVSMDCYGEKIATALYSRIFSRDEFVPYEVKIEGRDIYAVCPNMLKENEEFIPAYDVIINGFSYAQNTFHGFLEKTRNIDIEGKELFLNKMFIADFIIGNYDRHYRNFGFIRDVETLEYTRMAPVFDSGNSLWRNMNIIVPEKSSDYLAKPFGGGIGDYSTELIKEMPSLECVPLDVVQEFTEDIRSILAQNDNISKNRVEKIIESVCNQRDIVYKLQRERKPQVFVS